MAKNKSNKIEITRIYDAPLKMVWDAWTDPEQVKQWWGPRGFTLTHHSKELKPGGTWRYTMHGPDGVDYPNKTFYHEVIPYSRLVYDHGATDDTPPLFRVTATFEDVKGKTRLHMSMEFESVEKAIEIGKFIKLANGYSTWDRLAEFVEKNQTQNEIFVINRSFDCDIKTMYKLWTDPEHFSKWLAPTGFEMTFLRKDIKPGGSTFYYMEGHGKRMYGRAEYKEITPTKLVYVQQFSDENEKLARHPMAPTWPAYMQTTVTFAEEASDRTRVTIRWEVVGDYTREELETFIAGRAGMTQGWTGSLDKLEEYVQKIS